MDQRTSEPLPIQTSSLTHAPDPKQRMTRKIRTFAFGGGVVLCLIGGQIIFTNRQGTDVEPARAPSSVQIAGDKPLVETPPADDGAAAPEVSTVPVFRPEQVEGRWLGGGKIRREIELRPGGRATLNVRLDYLSALLYGREMNMELSWELKDGILSHTIISGTPVANVERLIRDFGRSLSYRVLEANDQEIVLEDLDAGKDRHHWVAVKSSEPSTSTR